MLVPKVSVFERVDCTWCCMLTRYELGSTGLLKHLLDTG